MITEIKIEQVEEWRRKVGKTVDELRELEGIMEMYILLEKEKEKEARKGYRVVYCNFGAKEKSADNDNTNAL